MATQTYYLSGEVQWAKVHAPDQKYNKCSLDLKPDAKSLELFHSMGLKNKVKDDGYITFRRDPEGKIWVNKQETVAGMPKVVDKDGRPSTDAIGNGSEVTIKVTTYDYDNKFGKGKGSRLESVRIDKLVIYNKEEQAAKASSLDGMF